MAHIRKLTDKQRTLPWRAQVRRKGHKVMVKMFKTKSEAEGWATEQERTIRLTGLPLTIDELKKYTLDELVRRQIHWIISLASAINLSDNHRFDLSRSLDPAVARPRPGEQL